MAEALSLAANILSVIQITAHVIQRLNDFKATAEGLPRALQPLRNELPTLNVSLKRIRQALDDGSVPDDSQEALEPLIKDFEEQIRALRTIVDKMLPKDNSNLVRNFKAVTSFRYDSEVKYIEGVIRGYSSTLTLEHVVSSSGRATTALRPPLIPRVICPFGQDPDFIERTFLNELLQLKGPGSRHALVGGGGVGKSMIAIEYGYRVQKASPDTWVFWVDAENINKFEEGYRDIAKALRITGAGDKEVDVFSLVYEWLRNEANATWVMIIDNADDKDLFTSTPPKCRGADTTKQIREFIPQSSNGSILVTSRSRDAAFQVTCNYKNLRTVEPMDEAEALALLRSQLDENYEEEDLKLLANTLDHIPLALIQAAAHISRRSLPIHDYLQGLEDAMANATSASLLDEEIPQLRRAGRPNSIVATWIITFEYVRKTMPSAARLLSLMCLFDRQDIPETLLHGQYGEEVNSLLPKTRKAWWKRSPRIRRKRKPLAKALPCNFEDDWLALRDLSLIKLNKDRHHFSMHPLVQFTTQKWLLQQKELDAWSQRFISILDATFYDLNSGNGGHKICSPLLAHAFRMIPCRPSDKDNGEHEICEPLLAHAFRAIAYRPSDKAIQPLQTWASLTRKIARYYDIRADFGTSEKLYHLAAVAFWITLGPDAPQTLKCITQRALVLLNDGQKVEAEKMHRCALRLQQAALGPEHPNTLDTLDHIGDCLVSQCRHSEAEVLHVQALETRLRIFGPAHESTQNALNKRFFFLLRRSRCAEAYTVWRQTTEAFSKGDLEFCDHLELIGFSPMIAGKWGDAEPYFRESLVLKERALPPGDLTVVKSNIMLAHILTEQEKFAEAETLFRRGLEGYDKPSWEKTKEIVEERLQAMGTLAFVLAGQEKLEEAETVARKCLVESEEVFGLQHCDTLRSAWTLAGVLEKQKRFKESLILYKRAYDGAKETQGEGDDNTKRYERDYTKLYDRLSVDSPHDETGADETKTDIVTQSLYDVEKGDNLAIVDRNARAMMGNAMLNVDGEDTCAGAEEHSALPTPPAYAEATEHVRIAIPTC